MEEPPDIELIINRFNRLVKEILQGEVRRTTFERWEVEFLVDFQACTLTRSRKEDALRKYQRVVQRQIERHQLPPARFSEFMVQRSRKGAPIEPLAPSIASDDPPSLHV
jgi:hypothetical protein